MPRLAASLTTLFTELPLAARFEAAAEAGFGGVEILFPYDVAVSELYRAAIGAGVEIVMIAAPPPNWAGGPRGFAALPGLEDRFRRDFDRSLRVAEALRARHINVMAGSARGPEARATLIRNLAWAAQRAPHASLTLEPVCPRLAPGAFLTGYDQAVELIAEIGAPNLGLQLDSHHAQAITGDLLGCWDRVRALTRHVQVASHPRRAEPGPEHATFLAALDRDGYRGWVSGEYHPARTTLAGLGWMSGRP